MRDFARTLEGLYWAMGLVIAVIGLLVVPLLGGRWVESGALEGGEVRLALVLLVLATAARWPMLLYGQGLVGLQRLVLWSGLRVVAEIVRNAGAVFLLWWLAPTVRVFFTWQLLAAVVTVAATALAFWSAMPHGEPRARFRLETLRSSSRFAAGMWSISVTAVLLVYLDKLVLSRLLPIEEFGYYMLAYTLAVGLSLVSSPLFQAFFPGLTQYQTNHDEVALARHYHRGSQWLAVAVFPLAAVMCVGAHEVMLVWTRSPAVAEHAAPLLRVLALGSALNAAMNMPYALQLAAGWTRMQFSVNALAAAVLLPALLLLVPHYGAMVAALLWCALNVIYMAVSVPITHRRLLRGELGRWYRDGLLLPLGAALAGAALGRAALHSDGEPWLRGVVTVLLSLAVSLALTVLAAPGPRHWACAAVQRARSGAARP